MGNIKLSKLQIILIFIILVITIIVFVLLLRLSSNQPSQNVQETEKEYSRSKDKILIFNIDQGFANGLIQTSRNEAILQNILTSINKLKTKYDVAVLMNPMNKDQSKVEKVLNFFAQNDVPFYLDVYSSDVVTIGSESSINNPYDTEKGLSISDNQVINYKNKFKSYLLGIRIFEVFGMDFTLRACKTTNPEWCEERWEKPANNFFNTELLENYLEISKENNMEVILSDWFWSKYAEWNTSQGSYELEVADVLNKYKDRVVVFYANNQPDEAGKQRINTDWETALNNLGKIREKGLSNQSWICSDETNCSVSILKDWVDDAFNKDIKYIEFEPVWYFWNLPRGNVSTSVYSTARYNGEETENMKELIKYLE